MEDPFDCSVVTLDLAGLDCECPSETKAEKLSRGDAWERCDDELIDGRKGKSSWWRPWRKDDRPEVSQVFEIHRDISHAETTYELPGDDCITPISLDGGRCETPVEALRSRFGHPSRPVPQGLHVPFGTAEIIAPGAIPSPINAAPEAIDVIAAQRVPSCGSCGPCGNGITKSFSLDPDGFSASFLQMFKETKLVQCLNAFKKGGTHMGLVRKAVTTVDVDPRFEIVGVLTLEDIVEEIIQEEIVDETDVYVDVDRRLKIGGRDTTNFNLGVFNPIWRSRGDKLSLEEVNAISAHLMRTAFAAGNGCALQYETITWLVGEAEVQNLSRNAPVRLDPSDTDWIYRRGQASSRCTLVLQGRLGAIVGHESFKTENGAFSLLARDALLPNPFKPDFDAFLSTPKVRILSIKKELFQRARELDKDPAMLEQAKKTQVLAVSVTRKQRWTYGGRDGPEDSGSPRELMSPTLSSKSKRPSQRSIWGDRSSL